MKTNKLVDQYGREYKRVEHDASSSCEHCGEDVSCVTYEGDISWCPACADAGGIIDSKQSYEDEIRDIEIKIVYHLSEAERLREELLPIWLYRLDK